MNLTEAQLKSFASLLSKLNAWEEEIDEEEEITISGPISVKLFGVVQPVVVDVDGWGQWRLEIETPAPVVAGEDFHSV